jgi:glutamate N-acetyltransferase/amino-acid N-acetyltransferase
MTAKVPQGFQLSGVHTGVKSNPAKEDLTLVVCDNPTVAAGVYTQNLVFAPSVKLNRERTPADNIRVVVVNSGNANACTGEQGWQDNLKMAQLAEQAAGGPEGSGLVMSTGIIGEHLPMAKISAGIEAAVEKLGTDDASLLAAARGILTTDKSHKLTGTSLELSGRTIQIAGFTKGAGMIGPRMATMLGLVLTDAPLTSEVAQEVLVDVIDETFNCISVEGHMSTSDTVLLLASGAAGGEPLSGDDLQTFTETLRTMCIELAQMIPADGEGASHLIEIEVQGCQNRQAAHQIAETVANSALVKTAVTGGDPNWGRIVSAAGYAGVPFDASRLDLYVCDTLLYKQGTPVAFDAAEVSAKMKASEKVDIVLRLAEGDASIRFWTSDLTVEYVQFNTEYHT